MQRNDLGNIAPFLAIGLISAAADPASAKIVSEAAMVSHCAEATATELGVMMNDVRTLPVERPGGKVHVHGQYPASDQDVTLFECQYDGKSAFLGLTVTGHHGHHTQAAGSAPRRAQRACTDMMGAEVRIEQVSPLRPGLAALIGKPGHCPSPNMPGEGDIGGPSRRSGGVRSMLARVRGAGQSRPAAIMKMFD